VDYNAEIADRNKFRWGLLLAWVPLLFFIVPTAIGVISAFVSMANQRATGLGAVAGGFAEVLATFGLVVVVGSEVVAIVMLLRTLSRSHPLRTVVAIVSVCCSGLLLSFVVLFLWFATVRRWR
jgi:hypothetical protein